MKTKFTLFLFFAALALSTQVGCDSGTGASGDTDTDTDGDTDTDSDSDTDADTDTDSDTDTDTDSDTDSDSDSDTEGPWDGTIDAAVTCTPSGDPCASLAADTGIYASYRKDAYLDETLYPESSLDWQAVAPVDGGRFHIVSIAANSGNVTDVKINGESVDDLLDSSTGTPDIEWYHVWPDPVVAGEPVWVAFHSRSADWDAPGTSGLIEVETDGGDAMNGTFDVEKSKAPLTYVTASDDLSELIIHARNFDTVGHTLQRLLVNGRDVLAADIACVPKTDIAAGESVMWTVPLCSPASLGAPWTVVADWDTTPDAVAGGRFTRPFFPIETWPAGSDCPMPGGNTTNLDLNNDAGFDTAYVYWGQSCSSYSTQEIVNTHAPAMTDDFNVLIGDDFKNLIDTQTTGLITDYSSVAGLLTGDESDGNIYDEADGSPLPDNKARYARWMWRNYPEVTIYNGAKTNKNVGTFAGMTDVQGIDLYVAACAPWICSTAPPPIHAAYDYLRNTRNNHMPWATWQYSQGMGTWSGQPDPHEIMVQAFSVMAAGGKGLMWFQTRQELIGDNLDTWEAMSRSNWVFRGVRDRLRAGDVTGAASATGNVIAEMIRSGDTLIIPLVSIETSSGPSLVSCGVASIGGPVPHWTMVDQTVDVSFDIPDDFAVADTFEILVDDSGAQILDMPYSAYISAREVTYSGIALNQTTPARILVLASTSDVRAEIEAAMAH